MCKWVLCATIQVDSKGGDIVLGGYISLLLPRLPKLPSQCYSNGPSSLGNLGINKEINLILVISLLTLKIYQQLTNQLATDQLITNQTAIKKRD